MTTTNHIHKPIIIGITGKKGSGKDTLFACIRQLMPNIKRLSVGDLIKNDICRKLNVTYERLESTKQDPIIRSLLQWWGWKYRVTYGQDYWLKQLMLATDYYQPSSKDSNTTPIFAMTDLRLKVEEAFIRGGNGYIIKINRPVNASEQGDLFDTEDHDTEVELDSIAPDYTVTNDKRIEWLQLEAKNIVQTIRERFKICQQ